MQLVCRLSAQDSIRFLTSLQQGLLDPVQYLSKWLLVWSDVLVGAAIVGPGAYCTAQAGHLRPYRLAEWHQCQERSHCTVPAASSAVLDSNRSGAVVELARSSQGAHDCLLVSCRLVSSMVADDV